MSNSIDYGTLALGALIGIGCKKQIKSAAKIAATTAASLASSAAVTVNSVAAQMYDSDQSSQADRNQVQNNQNGG